MSLDVMVADPRPNARVMIGNANSNVAGAVGASCPLSGAGPLSSGKGVAPGTADASGAAVPFRTIASVARDFLELTKPRIVTMVLVTALVAAVIASGRSIEPMVLVHLLIGVSMVAGSASAMNQVWERRIDAEMERTRRRPLPSGRMMVGVAAAFSVVLGVLGTAHLAYYLGAVPAIVGVITWITYVPIYTPLKTRSAWNTTVGAVSGALPVMIGYTAAGGSLYDVAGWLVVGVLVAWQYPHFMAIAWLYRRQYGEAGFQMTTTVEPTGRSAGWQSVSGMVLLVGCLLGLAVLPGETGALGRSVVAGLLLLVSYPMCMAAWRFARDRNDGTARKLLRASLLQLPASLLLLTVAALLG
jgi:protoheme IX farnesyltransferase